GPGGRGRANLAGGSALDLAIVARRFAWAEVPVDAAVPVRHLDLGQGGVGRIIHIRPDHQTDFLPTPTTSGIARARRAEQASRDAAVALDGYEGVLDVVVGGVPQVR